jgi:aryl-alcohol dehydrogenase-like predicted oxidoreductase
LLERGFSDNGRMNLRPLGRSGLRIAPLVFGGNVFGWTVDEPTAFRLLDRFVDSGLNAIDTADVYSRWVQGNKGGESETIIGNWLKRSPARRDQIVTHHQSRRGARRRRQGSFREEHRRRRRSVAQATADRPHRPLSQPPPGCAHADRGDARRVRRADPRGEGEGGGRLELDRLRLARGARHRRIEALPRYEVEQPEYNLCERGKFEGPLRDLCIAEASASSSTTASLPVSSPASTVRRPT